MPELPEVETILRTLEPVIVGQKIIDLFIGDKELRRKIDRRAIIENAKGASISSVFRRSKSLGWRLANGSFLIFHLGMSGRLGLFNPDSVREKHTHLIFTLENGIQVRYRDPRRFGAIDFVGSEKELERFFQNIGPEPLSKDFNSTYLFHISQNSRRSIKVLIMDSCSVAGIGNIYANEALFEAGIHPEAPAVKLGKDDAKRLVKSIQSVLNRAIKAGGTTLKDYRNAGGEPGFFQQELKVYGREGEGCVNCGQIIEKIILGNRASFVCNNCQK